MRILGIDYGRAKVGLAVAETKTGLTEPLLVKSPKKFLAEAAGLAKEQQIDRIVVGLPGGPLDSEIKKFGQEVGRATFLPVEFFDETLSTYEAQRRLIASGKKRKLRRDKEDAFAAAVMLESYLESRAD